LNYAFNNYQLNTLSLQDEHIDSITVNKGINPKLYVDVKDNVKMPLREDERKKLKEKITFPREVEAPVKKGQELGSITWELDGQELCKSTLIASADDRKKNIYDYFMDLVEELGRITQ
jgi:D-alanyl-D-alanine carboxypeptidase (penicillin-binding protein 5/6)